MRLEGAFIALADGTTSWFETGDSMTDCLIVGSLYVPPPFRRPRLRRWQRTVARAYAVRTYWRWTGAAALTMTPTWRARDGD